MTALLATFALAFLLAVAIVPLVRQICIRRRLYDSPGPLKIHCRPVPRLGGVAIALSLGITLALASRGGTSARLPWQFVVALAMIWLTGLIDDLRGLSPAIRVVAQIAGAALLWQGGWRLPWLNSGAASLATLALFVVAFVNAFNFLDGADGVAAGVASLVALAYLLHAGAASSVFASSLAAAFAGVCLGFIVYNVPPATIFMGDSGSTVLGFTVASLSLDFYHANPPSAPNAVFPLVVAALPLLDATLAVVRRLQNRKSPFYGDRSHFYDLLLQRGLSPRVVLFICLALTIALCTIASACLLLSFDRGLLLEGLSLIALLVICIRLGSLQMDREPRPLPRAPSRTVSPHV